MEYKFFPDELEIYQTLLKIKDFGKIQKLTESNKIDESKKKESKIEEKVKPGEEFFNFIEKLKIN